jgi:hypothetical protein
VNESLSLSDQKTQLSTTTTKFSKVNEYALAGALSPKAKNGKYHGRRTSFLYCGQLGNLVWVSDEKESQSVQVWSNVSLSPCPEALVSHRETRKEYEVLTHLGQLIKDLADKFAKKNRLFKENTNASHEKWQQLKNAPGSVPMVTFQTGRPVGVIRHDQASNAHVSKKTKGRAATS